MEENLSRREREIMDIVIAAGEVTAEDVRHELTDPPSSSAARAMLRRLVEKGFLEIRADGPRYIYSATIDAEEAGESAARRLVRVFYEGSVGRAVAGILGTGTEKLSEEDLRIMEDAIARARKNSRRKGRKKS